MLFLIPLTLCLLLWIKSSFDASVRSEFRETGTATRCQFFLQLVQGYGMFIYCISLGVSYPTGGGCTSLNNGHLPNQSNLDLGWWFEVYGAVGLTWMIISTAFCCCAGAKENQANNRLTTVLVLFATPLACTFMVFFVMGNVWFFHFTPATTFADGGSGGNASVPAGTVNGGGVINDGSTLATNCQWLSLNGFYMNIVQWIIFAVSCFFFVFNKFFCTICSN